MNLAAEQALRSLWRSIFWVSFPFGILSFVLPIYGRELGATALEIGGMFSAFALVPVLVRPFLGRALDRWGRRPFLLLGLAGYVVAMIFFAAADRIWLLTAGRFAQGMGQAFLWLSALTVVADLAAVTGRGFSFGTIDEATNRGAIFGTVIGFALISWLQGGLGLGMAQAWPLMFGVFTVPALAALLAAWRGVPETRPAEVPETGRPRPISAQLLALMGIVLVTGASSAMVWPLLMVFLQDSLHATVSGLALAYLPAALLSAYLPSRTGRLADRLGRKLLMALGLIVGAGASALIPLLRDLVMLAALWAVESIGYAASVPAERAFVADIAGVEARGTSYGFYTFAYFLGAVVGPLAGGWLYDNVGHSSPFYLNSVVLLLGALLVWAVLREPAKSASRSSGQE